MWGQSKIVLKDSKNWGEPILILSCLVGMSISSEKQSSRHGGHIYKHKLYSQLDFILSIGRLWLDSHRALLCRFNKQNALNLPSYIMLSNTPVICDHFKNPLMLFNFLLKLGEPKLVRTDKIKSLIHLICNLTTVE